MEDVRHSFADSAGPEHHGNKVLKRVKVHLRWRLSRLRSIGSAQSESRNAAISTSAFMQHRSVWILRIQSSYSRCMASSRNRLTSVTSGLENGGGMVCTSLLKASAPRR